MKKFYVIKKSSGSSCKSFNDEAKAKDFAQRCCQANANTDYIVCIYCEGLFIEI